MSPYQKFISSLNDLEIEQLARGNTGIGCNYDNYCLTDSKTTAVFLAPVQDQARQQIIDAENQVLEQLYTQQPLCRAEFEYRARQLLESVGAEKFCRHPGQPDNWALMIDGHQLVAIGPDDARNPYGYFCETEEAVNDAKAASLVIHWLESHEAYDDYRSKTVCRYCD